MPLTKFTGANLKKMKKDDLIRHIIDCYGFIDIFDNEAIFKKQITDLKEENEKLNTRWAKKRDEDGDSYRKLIKEWKDKYIALKKKNEKLKCEDEEEEEEKEYQPKGGRIDMEGAAIYYQNLYEKQKQEIEELKEENEELENEVDRLSELETIAWEDFYGEEEVIDDIKIYKFREDIIKMKEENEKLKWDEKDDEEDE